MPESPTIRDKHYPALDGLRGLAALMIVVHHSALFYRLTDWFDKAYLRATSLLWVGVDLFFVLSGFLITSILIETRHSKTYFRAFYGRRFLRIFPLYYAFLAGVYFLLPLLGGELTPSIRDVEPWQWTYTTNIYAALLGAMPDHNVSQSWTLAIEEQFYLLWPLVIFLLPARRITKTVIVLFLSVPFLRAISLAFGATPFFICTMTFCRIDCLFLGALLASLVHNGLLERITTPNAVRNLRMLDRAFLLSLVAFVAIYCIALRNDQFRFDVLTWPWYGQIFGLSLVGLPLGYAVFRCISPGTNWIQRSMMHPLLNSVGKYSYALYLLHAPICYWVGIHMPIPQVLMSLPPQWQFLRAIYIIVAEILLSILAAIISWNTWEKHFLKLKKYFSYRASRADTASA